MTIRMPSNYEHNLPYQLLLKASPDIARIGLRSDFGVTARSDKELLIRSLKKFGQDHLNAEEKWFVYACIVNLFRSTNLPEHERNVIYAALENLKIRVK
jgi:hypothetical protein